MTIAAGTKLGCYEIRSRLGAGGMGEVYLAWDSTLERNSALKILPMELASDPQRMRRFTQEAKTASTLSHPNVAHIYAIDEQVGQHFIAMEYVEGDTLRQHLSGDSVRIAEALDIAIQIASALSAAHAGSIVHRDIKPENIMLRSDGIVKVLDFGLAKLTEHKTDESEASTVLHTKEGIVMGTAHYMSPEQARGLRVDARTDLWSVGVVLYEMVAGQLPFKGPTSSDVIATILEREPITLARYSAEVPTELEWIVKKALRKDREERYQTARELLTDLKSLRRKLEFEEELQRSRESEPKGDFGRGAADTSSDASHAAVESRERRSRQVVDSLAILPLINNTTDPGMEYLSDGITESMINALSQLSELRVMAWSTVSRYKSHETDPRDAGRELGVRAVLTGRVMQIGERLVIKAELVDATDGSHLWGDSYSGKASDILDVEAEISTRLSEKLLIKLTTEERKRLTKRYTDNVEAYQLYLKGRYFWNKRTEAELKTAIEYFQKAIEKDPNYALAHAGIADSYCSLGFSFDAGALPPMEVMPQAKAAAVKALEIDGTLAEAHTSLAMINLIYDWDWPGAERGFKRAIELDPNYSNAHHWYSHYFLPMGRFEESLIESRRALELAPPDLIINVHLGWHYLYARQYDQAIEQLKKTLELDANYGLAHRYLGLAYEQKGMEAQAIDELQRGISLFGGHPINEGEIGHAYAVSGNESEARKVLDRLKKRSNQNYVSPYYLAIIHAGLGEKDQAFQWLEKGCDWRDGLMIHLNVEPRFDSLRSDPRFTALVKRVGLP